MYEWPSARWDDVLKYGSTHNGALTDLFSVCGGGRRGWMGGAWGWAVHVLIST